MDGEMKSRITVVCRPRSIDSRLQTKNSLFLETIIWAGDDVFQQENESFYQSRIIREIVKMFKEHSGEFQVMPWPLISPGMTSVKHMQFLLENRICAATLSYLNLFGLQGQLVRVTSTRYLRLPINHTSSQ
ncbi:hypothetical protein TNCV_300991 [Trichonephila clavipes]|nr:hypothetical protein TNCV_300991 [Trichonephila clavipes]